MRAIILGGTGTLGRSVARKLLDSDGANEVVVFSRCELKQQVMRKDFKNEKNLHFVVGDIRDRDRLRGLFDRANVVFHVAALKHVDVLELNPEESVRTNILGTINAADEAICAKVPHFVFSSTDKAIDPINVYGMSKGIAEKILYRRNQMQPVTKFSVYRWGNVVGSRGSVIPDFIQAIKDRRPIEVTSSYMTRFWIDIDRAADFMTGSYKTAPRDSAAVPSIRSASVFRVINKIADLLGVSKKEIKIIGIRPGEKLHESMISVHEEGHYSSAMDNMGDEELEKLLLPLL